MRRRTRALTAKARAVLGRLYYGLARLRPLDEHLAVYAACRFEGYGDNPAAIHAKAADLCPSVRGVWLVTESAVPRVPAGVPYAVTGSFAYWRALARATYVVSDFNLPANVVKRRGSVHLQARHGTMVKNAGVDLLTRPAATRGMSVAGLLKRADRWDYVLSANGFTSEVWERAYPCRFEVLPYGYPRNDVLFTATPEQVRAIRAECGVAPEQTAVLYAPTFRDYERIDGQPPRFRPRLDVARLADSLPGDHVLLVRAPRARPEGPDVERLIAAGRLVDVSDHQHVQHLCLAADVLVTDYASCLLDFANLDRPIICYLDDWDTYRRTRGVYLDLPEQAPGLVVTDEKALANALSTRAYATEQARAARAAFRRRYCEFDDGGAAERVVRRVYLGEQPAPSVPLDRRTPARVHEQAQRRMAAS